MPGDVDADLPGPDGRWIGGRLVADLIATAGTHRALAMTLHSPQVHGFFSIPVDHLYTMRRIHNGESVSVLFDAL